MSSGGESIGLYASEKKKRKGKRKLRRKVGTKVERRIHITVT